MGKFKKWISIGIITLLTGIPQQLVYANASTPPKNKTGSPIDGATSTCGNCHGGTDAANSPNMTLSGLPAQWQPNVSYPLTITVSGSSKYGFEITAENGTAKVGTFTAGTGSQILDAPGNHCLGQKNASSTNTWNFSYKAPAAGAGTITFYLTGTASKRVNYLKNYAVPEGASTPAPTITTQPANQSVTVGQTASFSVAASGTGLSYQWRMNGTSISGATSATYTTPATVIGDNGSSFQCVVTNAGGSVTSNAATLTVTSTIPTIQSQTGDQVVLVGQSVTFSVTASGAAPLSYQWKSATVLAGPYTSITGATNSNYNLPAPQLTDNGTYFECVVSNGGGNVTSTPAKLTVSATATPPTINTSPSNASVALGQTATFSVQATGSGPLSYQWQKNNVNISGATLSAYTTPATIGTDNGSTFRCVVSNSAGSATSASATLTVISLPTINTQPSNQTVTPGQAAHFSVSAVGIGTLNYQWQKEVPGGTWTNVGTNAANYTTPAVTTTDDGTLFHCIVSNNAGAVTSTSATLVINAPPEIVVQPVDAIVAVGQDTSFAIVVSGSLAPSFQWFRNNVSIPGAIGDTYDIPTASMVDNGASYSCRVSNSAGSQMSNSAILTVLDMSVTPPEFNPTNSIVGEADTLSIKSRYLMFGGVRWTLDGITGTLNPQLNPGGVSSVAVTRADYQMPLRGLNLIPGRYRVTASVVLDNGAASAPASMDINMSVSQLVHVRVVPNPWVGSRDRQSGMIFSNLTPNAVVKIFSGHGELVKILNAQGDSVLWDLKNDSGQNVSSGSYAYHVEDPQGNKVHGKIVIVK